MPTIPTDIEVWTAKLERLRGQDREDPARPDRPDGGGDPRTTSRRSSDSKDTQDLLPNANAAIGDARTLVRQRRRPDRPAVRRDQDDARPPRHRPGRRPEAGPSTSTAGSTRWPPRPRPRSRRPRRIGDARPLIEDLRRIAAKLDAQADPLLTSLRSDVGLGPRRRWNERSSRSGSVDQTLDQESPLGFELFQMLKEFRAAAQALRSLADYLERVPDAPVYGVRRPSGGAK